MAHYCLGVGRREKTGEETAKEPVTQERNQGRVLGEGGSHMSPTDPVRGLGAPTALGNEEVFGDRDREGAPFSATNASLEWFRERTG